MGCCESLPDVPKNIQPDPDSTTAVTVSVAKMGWSQDFAVYRGDTLPTTSEGKVEDMWLWFNKTKTGGRNVDIDVENFKRGGKQDKTKGEVLWRAKFVDSPVFNCYQKNIRQTPKLRYLSVFGKDNGYNSDDDDYYVNHNRHRSTPGSGKHSKGSIITKWSLTTQALISNVDFDRAATNAGLESKGSDVAPDGTPVIAPGKETMVLNVFSKGTVVTTYFEREVTEKDSNGHSHRKTEYTRRENEFIDRIEYQLVFNGKTIFQWVQPGDGKYAEDSTETVNLICPMFDISYVGGWWKKDFTVVKTKKHVDPALAMLVAHLCATEYSAAAIKDDLKVNTPARWPKQGGFKFY